MNKIILGNHINNLYRDVLYIPDFQTEYFKDNLGSFASMMYNRQCVIEELENIDLDNIKNNSKENNISDKFLIAKNNVLLAVYIKITKTLYTYKKDDEGLWIDNSLDEDIDCISIEVEDGDFPNYSFYLKE